MVPGEAPLGRDPPGPGRRPGANAAAPSVHRQRAARPANMAPAAAPRRRGAAPAPLPGAVRPARARGRPGPWRRRSRSQPGAAPRARSLPAPRPSNLACHPAKAAPERASGIPPPRSLPHSQIHQPPFPRPLQHRGPGYSAVPSPCTRDRLPCSLVSIPGSAAWDRTLARSCVCGSPALPVPADTTEKPLLSQHCPVAHIPQCWVLRKILRPLLALGRYPPFPSGTWEPRVRDIPTSVHMPVPCTAGSASAHPSRALWLGNIFLSSMGRLPLLL